MFLLGELGFLNINLELMPFVSAIKAMNKVVDDCFSTKLKNDELDTHIYNLKKCFEGTELAETLKIHVIFKHLKYCLHFLRQDGLRLWSEQAGESVHREFLNFWERYKINVLEDSRCIDQLLKAVVEFNFQHL